MSERGPQPAPPEVRQSPQSPEGLTWQHFDDRFTDIRAELDRHAQRGEAQAGLRSAHEAYVAEEGDPALQKFGKLMLLANRARAEWQTVSQLNDLRSGRELGTRPGGQERERRRQATRIACAYNQLIGSLVADNEAALPRPKLEQWLAEAGEGDQQWASRLMAGVAAERAAEKLLQGVPGIEGVMHGDLDQDLQGQDFVFEPTRMGYSSLDVKQRRLEGVMPVERHPLNGHMTLYIDPRHMDRKRYEVMPQYRDGYQQVLERVLVRGEDLRRLQHGRTAGPDWEVA